MPPLVDAPLLTTIRRNWSSKLPALPSILVGSVFVVAVLVLLLRTQHDPHPHAFLSSCQARQQRDGQAPVRRPNESLQRVMYMSMFVFREKQQTDSRPPAAKVCGFGPAVSGARACCRLHLNLHIHIPTVIVLACILRRTKTSSTPENSPASITPKRIHILWTAAVTTSVVLAPSVRSVAGTFLATTDNSHTGNLAQHSTHGLDRRHLTHDERVTFYRCGRPAQKGGTQRVHEEEAASQKAATPSARPASHDSRTRAKRRTIHDLKSATAHKWRHRRTATANGRRQLAGVPHLRLYGTPSCRASTTTP